MEITLAFALLATLLRFGASAFYIRDVYQERNHPQRAAWVIFFVLNVIFLATQFAEGARYSIMSLTLGTLTMLVVLPKLRSTGVGGFDTRDKVSLLTATVGLALWAITSEPLIALFASLAVDAAGAWLVIEKTWRLPWSETWIAWFVSIFTSFLSLLSVGSFDFELMVVPGYLGAIALVMNLIMWHRRKIIPNPELTG